ncbi:unnamed protein product, partial [Enterobius vermicularis]|uniref:Ovule protein n=1 Tax=Enterobius vermicularis TaxID=51028 RepID=A0A0N4VLG5_ENTVE
MFDLFTWECDDVSCCESYRFRVLLLFVSLSFIVLAIIVALVWLSFEFRPSYSFMKCFSSSTKV